MQSSSNPFQKNRFANKGQELQQFYFSAFRSASLFHWIGYGLLLYVGLDLVAIFYPSYFGDPSWQFQTLGQLVERVPVPLLGLLLVFFGERKPRISWEFPLLRVLSWMTLLSGLLFLLAIPLGIMDTIQLDTLSQEQINLKVDQQLAQVQQVESQVQKSTSSSRMIALAQRYNLDEIDIPQTSGAEIEIEDLRSQLADALAQRQQVIESNREEKLVGQRNRLLKQSVKWNIGALIASLLLIGLWKGTNWAR